MSVHATPRRLLDVGCGTGYLLRLLAKRCPNASELAGVDPAPSMIETAQQTADDRRLRFTVGAAERLPYPDHHFALVVSTTSFDHWADQRAGLGECARVLAPGGHLVLADLFSPLLLPTLLAGCAPFRGAEPARHSALPGSRVWPGMTCTHSSSRP